jgi:hypothetical protein
LEGKYITFKREDFDELLVQVAHIGLTPKIGEVLNGLLEREVEDGVVIRLQDAFAPPALDAYANSIVCATELMGESPERDRLREISDYFSEQAALSWATKRKLPD